MIKRSVFLPIAILLFSCHSHDAVIRAPSNKEVVASIMDMYREMSAADGGGDYHITQIEIIEKKPVKEADHYYVKVKVAGMHRHPPLASPKPGETYSEMREEELIYKNGYWVWHDAGK